jgi:hypothetical protein
MLALREKYSSVLTLRLLLSELPLEHCRFALVLTIAATTRRACCQRDADRCLSSSVVVVCLASTMIDLKRSFVLARR